MLSEHPLLLHTSMKVPYFYGNAIATKLHYIPAGNETVVLPDPQSFDTVSIAV